ncbi:MAG: saccharopine dehydrogenase C-terminal domain-containing protein [Xanthobacteraceae bacterium]
MIGKPVRIAVVGAGQIGWVIANMLIEQGHEVRLADSSSERLAESPSGKLDLALMNAANPDELSAFLTDRDIVISACPYFLNRDIAQAAIDTNTHYFDLTEDVETTAYIRHVAQSSPVALMPQCGLAPGFICVLGADMAARFDRVKAIRLRVGALPLYPTNALRYNVTWSIDGLINEYCNPCKIVSNGQMREVPALEGGESVMIDGTIYEAFNTSGGLGTLAETLSGRVDELSYKTLRYPGHAEIMHLLLHGLGLAEDRATMKRILARAAPFTRSDIVVVFVTGIGERNGRLEECSTILRYDGRPELGAIQLTTAAGCVAMVELFLAGMLPANGFIRQEDAKLVDFFATKAGARLIHESRDGGARLLPSLGDDCTVASRNPPIR